MRRVLVATFLALLVAAPAAAQDEWPTVEELRGDLSDIGWVWEASELAWWGGPVDGARVRLEAVEGKLRVLIGLGELVGFADGEGWTVFREVAVRLPVPDEVQLQVAQVATADVDGCGDFFLTGGTVTVERYEGYSRVWVDQEGEAGCPALAALRAEQEAQAAASLPPGAVESPAG